MAGVYVHIPFCRRACHYCDFHFTTNLKNSRDLVDAILTEIEFRQNYLDGEPIWTIYFGGGTPSLLPTAEIERILNAIHRTQQVEDEIELTLEANPEDLSKEKLLELKSIGVNRLSLGAQSFIDAELKWMNRLHTAQQAIQVISDARQVGFDNISIDLIFGLPDQTGSDWQRNLNQAIELDIQHISSYSLTVEPKTVLKNRIQKGQQQPPDENTSAQCFEMNMEFLPQHGFEHYEISNYAKKNFISQHNSSYWQGINYLGLGPSAHSFNGMERQWNIRSNGAYVQKICSGENFSESEELTPTDRVNEHIMTGLRTKWGIQRSKLEDLAPGSWNVILTAIKGLKAGDVTVEPEAIYLTDQGKLTADIISASLFID